MVKKNCVLISIIFGVFCGLAKAHEPSVVLKEGRYAAVSIARIVNQGELVVAMHSKDQVPFFYDVAGETVGTDVMLASSLAQALNVKLKIIRSAESFDGVVDQVVTRKADLAISKISRTLRRSLRVSFSKPYVTFRQALLLNRLEFAKLSADRSLRDVLLSFNGSIGVIAKSSFVDFAKQNFPKAKVVEYETYNEVVKAVSDGQVTAGYRDEFEVKKVLQNDPSRSLMLRVVTLDDLVDTIGVVISTEDTALRSFVDMYLEQKYKPYSVDELLELTKRIKGK